MPGPKEFTPEISEDYYNRLAGRIQKRGEQSVGLARGEALAAGREGDPYEGVLTGAARSSTSRELADLDANLAYQLAGLGREERLIGEGRGWQSAESQKEFERDTAFRERMARLNETWQDEAESTANRRQMQQALWSLPATLIGAGAGFAGSYYGGRKNTTGGMAVG